MELAITNTYFQHAEKHFFSLTHSRSKRAHFLDYVITRRRDLKNIKDTRAMRYPDCDTDHHFIKTKLNFWIKSQFSKTVAPRKQRIDVAKLNNCNCQGELKVSITAAVRDNHPENNTPQELWSTMNPATFKASAEIPGFTNRKNEHEIEIHELINEKKKTHFIENKI